MEKRLNQISGSSFQNSEFHFDSNANSFEDFFKNAGANTSSPKKISSFSVNPQYLKPLSGCKPRKIEFEASSFLFEEKRVSAAEKENESKQRHREKERLRAQQEKKNLSKLFEMLPPSLKNANTQIKQLTNVVHYIAFLEMFAAVHERDDQTHCPLLHSLFGPDFRKELSINSILSSEFSSITEGIALEDIISNLKMKINQMFVHQQQSTQTSPMDLSYSASSQTDSMESMMSLSSDLSFPYEASGSGTSSNEMQEINDILPARFVLQQTNPNRLDSC